MKKMLSLIMAAAIFLPHAAVAQGVEVIEAGTVMVVVAVYTGTEWAVVADGVVPPTYISCQPQ